MGYVNVSVDSEGLYVYKITVDPLTTAWYKRCFNKGNILAYQPNGTSKVKDPRVSYNEGDVEDYIGYWQNVVYDLIQPTPYMGDWVVMVCLTPEYHTVQETRTTVQNPAFNVYLMRDVAFRDFYEQFLDLTDEEQKQYVNCIVKLFTIRKEDGFSIAYRLTQEDTISLYVVNNSTLTDPPKEQIDIILTRDNKCYNITQTRIAEKMEISSTYQLHPGTTSLNLETIQPEYAGSTVILNLPDLGIVQVPSIELQTVAAQIKEHYPTATIQLEFIKYFDFVGGQQSGLLRLIGVEPDGSIHGDSFIDLFQYRVQSTIPEAFPFMFDSSVTHW